MFRSGFKISIIFLFSFLMFQVAHSQEEKKYQIDSIMDLSPEYLPTYKAFATNIEFMPLQFLLIDTNLEQVNHYDPTMRTENIYQTLGTTGQAHKSLIYSYDRKMGVEYQVFPYPFYFKKQSDLEFYKMKSTYSNIAYAFGFPKESEFFATFAKSTKGVTIAANIFANFNEGAFVHQINRNLCGDFFLHYEIPSSIYGFRASYIINHLSNFENGGLLNPEDYMNKTAVNNAGYAVRSPNASTWITTQDLALQNYVNIINSNKKYFGTFSYDFQYQQDKTKYLDQHDTIYPYYGSFFSTEATNDSAKFFNVRNVLQWSNFKPYQEAKTKNYFFNIVGGIMHEYYGLTYVKRSSNSFTLFARTELRLFKEMDIFANFSYSFNGYIANDAIAKVGASWAINREKNHLIGIQAHFSRTAPEYVMTYRNSNHFQWDTTFAKQNITALKLFWTFKGYRASLNYYYIDNLVYLNHQYQPEQNIANGNFIQLSTYIPYRYKQFGVDANLNLQYCSKDVIKVPIFAGKISVFYIFQLLKKRLKIQVGVDGMYNTAFFADGYLPVTQQFYQQKTQKIGNFFYFDANITVRIERLAFYLRGGNLVGILQSNRSFSTPNYPLKNFGINIGITWRFHD